MSEKIILAIVRTLFGFSVTIGSLAVILFTAMLVIFLGLGKFLVLLILFIIALPFFYHVGKRALPD